MIVLRAYINVKSVEKLNVLEELEIFHNRRESRILNEKLQCKPHSILNHLFDNKYPADAYLNVNKNIN